MLTAGMGRVLLIGLQTLSRDRRAITSLEYALIAVIIIVAIVGGVSRIGNGVGNSFNSVASGF